MKTSSPAGLLAVACAVLTGCGGPETASPVTPSTAGLAISLVVSPDAIATGFRSPTSLRLQVHDTSGQGATLEEATLTIRDAGGSILSRAHHVGPTPIGPSQFAEVARTLSWPSAETGRRLDVAATIREPGGAFRVVERTIDFP
jgi:hypothetical protein